MDPAPPSIRFDPATGQTAVRTALDAPREWLIVTPTNGGRYAEPNEPDTWQVITP